MKVHLGVASLKVRCLFLGLTRIALAMTIIITIIIICRVSPHHVVLRHWNSESETSTLILKFSFEPSLLKCESDTSSVKVIRQENMTSIARGLVTQKHTLCTIDSIHQLDYRIYADIFEFIISFGLCGKLVPHFQPSQNLNFSREISGSKSETRGNLWRNG